MNYLIIVLLSFFLAACGDSNSSSEKDSAAQDTDADTATVESATPSDSDTAVTTQPAGTLSISFSTTYLLDDTKAGDYTYLEQHLTAIQKTAAFTGASGFGTFPAKDIKYEVYGLKKGNQIVILQMAFDAKAHPVNPFIQLTIDKDSLAVQDTYQFKVSSVPGRLMLFDVSDSLGFSCVRGVGSGSILLTKAEKLTDPEGGALALGGSASIFGITATPEGDLTALFSSEGKPVCQNIENDSDPGSDIDTALADENGSEGTSGTDYDLPSDTEKPDTDVTFTKLYPVKKGGKWGYINEQGELAVDPASHNFDRGATYYREGLAAVQTADYKWGYINEKGDWVVNPKYDMANSYTPEGVAAVGTLVSAGKYDFTFIDKTGKENAISATRYEWANPFSEGLAAVQKNDLYGFINAQGATIITHQFDDTLSFSEGFAAVKKDLKWSYITKTGTAAFAGQWDKVKDFSEGFAVVQTQIGSANGQPVYDYQFIKTTGELAFSGKKFEVAKSFSNGYAPVKLGGKWKYIATTGDIVIDPATLTLVDAWDFSNNLAPVEIETAADVYEWGYIDTTGTMIITPQFYWALPFFGQLAQVLELDSQKKTLYGFIDKTGKAVWEPQN